MSVPEPWREDGDDDALALAVKHAGEALADRMGWHPTRADYAMARTVILSAREWLEAPLKVENERLSAEYQHVLDMREQERLGMAEEIHRGRTRAENAEARVATLEAENRALTASLRAANATTRTAQGRAERAEALFRERNP